MGGNGEVNTKRWKLKFEIICCFYLKGRVLQTVNSSFELTIAVAGLDLFRKKRLIITNICLLFKFHFSDILQHKSWGCCPALDDKWMMRLLKIFPLQNMSQWLKRTYTNTVTFQKINVLKSFRIQKASVVSTEEVRIVMKFWPTLISPGRHRGQKEQIKLLIALSRFSFVTPCSRPCVPCGNCCRAYPPLHSKIANFYSIQFSGKGLRIQQKRGSIF